MKSVKETYQFTNWPNKSAFRSEKKFVNETDIFPDYQLLNRYPLFTENSYRDVYVNKDNPNDRVLLEVINLPSFEEAKEQMIDHLSQCAAPEIPQLVSNDGAYDIAFGTVPDNEGAISLVRGNTFINIRGIGSEQSNIKPFLESLYQENKEEPS